MISKAEIYGTHLSGDAGNMSELQWYPRFVCVCVCYFITSFKGLVGVRCLYLNKSRMAQRKQK